MEESRGGWGSEGVVILQVKLLDSDKATNVPGSVHVSSSCQLEYRNYNSNC